MRKEEFEALGIEKSLAEKAAEASKRNWKAMYQKRNTMQNSRNAHS